MLVESCGTLVVGELWSVGVVECGGCGVWGSRSVGSQSVGLRSVGVGVCGVSGVWGQGEWGLCCVGDTGENSTVLYYSPSTSYPPQFTS